MTSDPVPALPEARPEALPEARSEAHTAAPRDGCVGRLERHLARCRHRVPAFVARHLGLRGSLRLHRVALGWDVARAPVNILLGIVHLACDLLGRLALRLGWPHTGTWLRHRHWVLRTQVMRRPDHALREELLQLSGAGRARTQPRRPWRRPWIG